MIQGFQRAGKGELDIVLPGIGSTGVPSLVTVQSKGCAPLNRAFYKMRDAGVKPDEASKDKSTYMFPWDNPQSVASGILDDETYDWVELVKGMEGTGGDALVVEDDIIEEANAFAKKECKVNSCMTGSVGLAGLMSKSRSGGKALS